MPSIYLRGHNPPKANPKEINNTKLNNEQRLLIDAWLLHQKDVALNAAAKLDMPEFRDQYGLMQGTANHWKRVLQSIDWLRSRLTLLKEDGGADHISRSDDLGSGS